jgi:hypothetical protein
VEALDTLLSFMEAVGQDPRIAPVHVSVYLALLHTWDVQGRVEPVLFKARKLMPAAKVRGRALFYRTIRQLSEYGYIRYEPSFKPEEPSRVWLEGIDQV